MVWRKSLDEELPERDGNHALEDISESRLISALEEAGLFVAQGSDRKDYGTDLQLEAIDGGRMTNVRVHVQLKGTRARLNADGSVSRKVERANLNYLLAHPNSVYVCLHAPTGELFARYAEEVHGELALPEARVGFDGRSVERVMNGLAVKLRGLPLVWQQVGRGHAGGIVAIERAITSIGRGDVDLCLVGAPRGLRGVQQDEGERQWHRQQAQDDARRGHLVADDAWRRSLQLWQEVC